MRSPINAYRRTGSQSTQTVPDTSEPASLTDIHNRMKAAPGKNYGQVFDTGGGLNVWFVEKGVCDRSAWEFDRVRGGVKHARIPVCFSYWSGMDVSAATISPVMLARVVALITSALEVFDTVILDPLHTYKGLMGVSDMPNYLGQAETLLTTAQHAQRAGVILQQVAAAFSAFTKRLIIEASPNEIYNKTGTYWTNATYNAFTSNCVTACRTGGGNNATRALMVSPQFASTSYLPGFTVPSGGNLIVTGHLYSPHTYTHQGQIPGTTVNGWAVGAWMYSAAQIEADAWAAFSAANSNVPINVGEFGVTSGWSGSAALTDMTGRAAFLAYQRKLFIDRGFSSHIWSSPDFAVTGRSITTSFDGGWAPGFPAALAGAAAPTLPSTAAVPAGLCVTSATDIAPTLNTSTGVLTIPAYSGAGAQIQVYMSAAYVLGQTWAMFPSIPDALRSAGLVLQLGGASNPAATWAQAPQFELGAQTGFGGFTFASNGSSAVASGASPKVACFITVPTGFPGGTIDLSGVIHRIA